MNAQEGITQLSLSVQGQFSWEANFELFPEVMTRKNTGHAMQKNILCSGTEYRTV